MEKREIEVIADTIFRLAAPGLMPKDLLRAVLAEHPSALKCEVVRGAFYAVIVHADEDLNRARLIHDFAMTERLMPNDGSH